MSESCISMVDIWLKLKIVSVMDIFFHMVFSFDWVWGHFYADHIQFLMHPSVWEHDRGGCNNLQRGNCGWLGCLPQWTWDWGTKLKDRIIGKIQIEIGQQTQPLSHLSKITPLLLPSIFLLSLNIYHFWNNSIFSKCVPQFYTAESNSTPSSQEQDFFHLLNLLQGLFRNVPLTLRWEWPWDYAAVLILALD